MLEGDAAGLYLLPHGDVDDDEEQQGERRDPAANDERHGREQRLVHDLQREERTGLLVMATNTRRDGHAESKHTHTHDKEESLSTCAIWDGRRRPGGKQPNGHGSDKVIPR